MNKEESDELLKVLISSFVWVASADEDVKNTEMTKYEHVMMQSQFATQFEAADIRPYFKDMVTMFSDDYAAGIQLTKKRLEKIRGREHFAEEVLRVCRAAIVSDGKITDSEESVLSQIAEVLGINRD